MILTQNDSVFARYPRLWLSLLVLNVVSALIPGYYGVAALVAPEARAGIIGPRTDDLVMYASLYGIRAALIAVVLLVLLIADRRTGGRRLVPMLLLAGTVQACDTVLLLATGMTAMAVGPLVSVIVHLGTAGVLRRSTRPTSLVAAAGR